MIHPSYFELMDIVNKDVAEGEEPIVTSRYSIVLGTAKRARQLVEAENAYLDRKMTREQEPEPVRTLSNGKKPLSIAVEELRTGDIHILRTENVAEDDE